MTDSALPCKLWDGYVGSDGYGRIHRQGANSTLIHRVVYETHKGLIPLGFEVDHLCHNGSDCIGGYSCIHRRCIEETHLEAVIHKENCLRGKSFARQNADQTICPQGHPYSTENTIFEPGRRCRICRNERRRRRRTRTR